MREGGYRVDVIRNRIEVEFNEFKPEITFSCVSDPSEIITYMSLAVFHNIELKLGRITGDRIFPILEPEFSAMREMGVDFLVEENQIVVKRNAKINSIDLEITSGGVCTDQHPFFVLMMLRGGGSLVEHVWHDRFNYIPQLAKFGIEIERAGNAISVDPAEPSMPKGDVDGCDLRACAMLTILSIGLPQSVSISNAAHLRRGYQGFLNNLKKLGADLEFN
jgi:UDP-N-acetylglucosamine 1-carboxyvinyltransferase